MSTIKEALLDMNPWWKEGFALEFKERDVYTQVRKFMGMPQIVALMGLRRVGKTTLMLKMAQDSIGNGSDPRNIVYFSFDDFRETEIREVMKEYETISEKDFRSGRFMLLLDEVQKVGNWEDQLKRIYDTFGKTVKIVISGSESLFLKRKSKESLAGRIFEFKVDTLSFGEFLRFKNISYKPPGLHGRELSRLFKEFTVTQGFPELVGVSDRDIIRKYIMEGIAEKIVYRDIPELFRIKDTAVIRSLLNIFMEGPGQIVEISDIAKELKISRQTVSLYLSYLEESFLLKKLYNFSKGRRKVERKLKKYYPSIISVDLSFRDDDLSRSKVFEWMVVSQTKAGFFWRDPYKNEVDIVLSNGKTIPIEVKYGKPDSKGLLAFMKRFSVNEGWIISTEIEEKRIHEGKAIRIVPAYKFLLEQSPAALGNSG